MASATPPAHKPSITLSARAFARTGGDTSVPLPCKSAIAASSHAAPSATRRPRRQPGAYEPLFRRRQRVQVRLLDPGAVALDQRRGGPRNDLLGGVNRRSVIEFDGNGRMYVSELLSYMVDAEATREHDPISRISRPQWSGLPRLVVM